MKIRVTLTVDIDPQAWEANYGIDASDKPAIRDDVRTYVENGAREQLDNVGVLLGASAMIV